MWSLRRRHPWITMMVRFTDPSPSRTVNCLRIRCWLTKHRHVVCLVHTEWCRNLDSLTSVCQTLGNYTFVCNFAKCLQISVWNGFQICIFFHMPINVLMSLKQLLELIQCFISHVSTFLNILYIEIFSNFWLRLVCTVYCSQFSAPSCDWSQWFLKASWSSLFVLFTTSSNENMCVVQGCIFASVWTKKSLKNF